MKPLISYQVLSMLLACLLSACLSPSHSSAALDFATLWPALPYMLLIAIALLIHKLDTAARTVIDNKSYYRMWIVIVSFINAYILTHILVGLYDDQEKRFLPLLAYVLITIVCYYAKFLPPNRFVGFRTSDTLRDIGLWKATHARLAKLALGLLLPVVLLNIIVDVRHLSVVLICYILVLLLATLYAVEQYKNRAK